MTLTADIAQSYIAIRTLQTQIQVAQTNVTLQTESLRIASVQYQAGQTSLLDVTQAQTQLATTQATVPSLVSQLATQKDALAVLLGTTPDKVDALLGATQAIPQAPATVIVGIPQDLLRNRPDVQQAELAAAAQSALLGVAKAQLYPALSLSGTFGFESSDAATASLGKLFHWSSHTVNLGPSVQIPIFNYGQLTNQVREQDSVFQQSIMTYQNTVLQAQQEVQDAIADYEQAQNACATYAIAEKSAVQSTNLAMIRYEDGATDYTTVITVEQQQLQVQNSLAEAQGNMPRALVALYTGLGGGWQISDGHDVIAADTKSEMQARTNWGGCWRSPTTARRRTAPDRSNKPMSQFGNFMKRKHISHCTVLSIGCVMATAGCGKSNSYKPPPPAPVITSKPVQMQMTSYLSVTGNTVAFNSVQLVARVAGYLEGIDYTDGTVVKKNQVLFVIEPAPYRAKLDQAQAAVAQAKAQVVYAQAQYDRQETMIKQNATSHADVEQSMATRDVDQAQVLQAIANQELAQINFGYTEVTASFDGRVSRHLVDIGNLVGTGTGTGLATIEQINPIYVYFNVNELDALKIRAAIQANGGDPDKVIGKSVFVGLQSESGFPHSGHLDYVATGLDPSTGTIELRAVLKNDNDVLVPGLFVRAQIPLASPADVVALPDAAVETDQTGSYVFVVGRNNMVAQKHVVTGTTENGMTAVTGLNASDQVVVNGIQNAAPGSVVAPTEKDLVAPPATQADPG